MRKQFGENLDVDVRRKRRSSSTITAATSTTSTVRNLQEWIDRQSRRTYGGEVLVLYAGGHSALRGHSLRSRPMTNKRSFSLKPRGTAAVGSGDSRSSLVWSLWSSSRLQRPKTSRMCSIHKATDDPTSNLPQPLLHISDSSFAVQIAVEPDFKGGTKRMERKEAAVVGCSFIKRHAGPFSLTRLEAVA